MLRISEYSAEQLVYLDKSAANERIGDFRYGWAPVGGKTISVVLYVC